MAAATTVAAIAVGAAVVGTGYSIYQQRRAGKAQEKAIKVQRRQREAEQARLRRQQIAEARRRRAAVLNASQQVGGAGSSGETQALGSIQSQLGSNLGFQRQSGDRAARVEMFGGKANEAFTQAAIGQGVASIGSSIFSTFGGAPESPKPKPRQANPGSPLFDTPGPRN